MIDRTAFRLLAALTVLASAVGPAAGMSCYQCNSTDMENQFRCSVNADSYDLTPEPCSNVHGAAYCVKLTGRYEGGLGAKRFCSAHDLGNYCSYAKQPGDRIDYRTCVYTCDSDNCNGSLQVKSFGYLMGLLTFVPRFRCSRPFF